MKKLENRTYQFFNLILGGILCLLGFSGCDSDGDVVEYGAPHADYVIKGKVVAAETGEGIPEILIEVRSDFGEWEGEIYYKTDSVFTNNKGGFEWRHGQIETGREFTLIASVPNVPVKEAAFLPDTVQVSFKDVKFTGKDRWYMGKAEVEQNIQLNKNPKPRDK